MSCSYKLHYKFHKFCFSHFVPELSIRATSFQGHTLSNYDFFFFLHRMKEAQENIKKITAEKRVETKKINANSLVRTDLHTAENWVEFPASCSFLVSALTSVHSSCGFSANRKRGCGRRKPACPPAEMTCDGNKAGD